MSAGLFDHVDLRVTDVPAARKFYDLFLPAIGFANIGDCNGAVCYRTVGDAKTASFIELNAAPEHRANANRMAFGATSEEEVNRLGEIARQAGAVNVEGPAYCAEYTPGYYAVFFEDADGNRWEICCRTARVR